MYEQFVERTVYSRIIIPSSALDPRLVGCKLARHARTDRPIGYRYVLSG